MRCQSHCYYPFDALSTSHNNTDRKMCDLFLVGLHQGSPLLLFMFIVFMDRISWQIQVQEASTSVVSGSQLKLYGFVDLYILQLSSFGHSTT